MPKKFGVDKRKLHLSTLIISKQITRDQAIKALASDPYPSEALLEQDRSYFVKKMQMSDIEFEDYIQRKPIPHNEYPSEQNTVALVQRAKKLLFR